MKRIVTFLLILLAGFNFTLAQKVDYEKEYNWFLGFNAGATWHTTDVQNRYKGGFGFTIGKSYNMTYGHPFSFDLRGRYLRGYWEGRDTDTTNAIAGNKPVSAYYANPTYDSLGYTKQNFLSDQHRIALELAIHVNSIREKTGFDPYIFGGIGVTAHSNYGDLFKYNADGIPVVYDYANNENIEGVYDVPLAASATENYPTNKYKWSFMPSLGFGLGYYFHPRASIGIEHKTTFALNDYYDGTIVNQDGVNNKKNDLYHYTSGYLRFYVGGNRYDDRTEKPVEPNPDPVQQDNPDPVATNESQVRPPVVNYTVPAISPKVVNTPNYTIKANVNYIAGRNNIVFLQNGNANTSFTYNATTDLFTAAVTLNPGQNVFEITATNEDGEDQETIILNYKRETPVLPVVTFTNPTTSPETVNNENFILGANVLNVSNIQGISMTLNGVNYTAFNFNANNSGLTSNLILKPGVNIINITGTNTAGSDSENTTIIYRPQVQRKPPVVNFTNPITSPYTQTASQFNLVGTLLNVGATNGVRFKQNGTLNSNFSFNTNTHQFTSTVNLQPGQNVFELIGTNNDGTDQATTIIVYDKPDPKPPVVTISNPTNNPHTTNNNTQTFNATVLNVSNANQVSVTLNGANYTNFNFVGNTLSSNLPLIQGVNVVTVTATNNDGTDSKQTTIVYRPVATPQAPIVNYIMPSNSPHNTAIATQAIRATVLNVTNQNQINVNVNGSNFTNYTFSPSSHLVQFTMSLIEGVNIVTITGTNTAGVDSETMTIIYTKPQAQILPVVTFINPLQDVVTVYNANYLVKARVQHVQGAQNITVKVNGVQTNNFNYSASNQIVTFSTGLVAGANSVEIKGVNNAGQDLESRTIIFKRQVTTTPPVVNITNPVSTVYTTSNQSLNITATLQHVASANDIQVLINNVPFAGFVYNANTHVLSLSMHLNNGSNTIKITGTNNAGSDTDNAIIIYKPAAVVKPPVVTFTKPNVNGTTVNFPAYQIKATVLHVNEKANVLLKMNGQIVNPNSYMFNAATHELSYNSNLTAGNNVFYVQGTNSAGQHSSTKSIIYKTIVIEDCKAPKITILQPTANNTTVNSNLYTLKAKVENVVNKNEITLFINGINTTFTYNASTKILSKAITLNTGNNVVSIKAINRCGRHSATKSLNYVRPEKPCVTPSVQLIAPNNGYTTADNSVAVKVRVANAIKTNISFKVNGVVKPFSFDVATQMLSANVNLLVGENKMTVSASAVRRECGSDSKTWSVTRTECLKPVINVTANPSLNTTVSTSTVKLTGNITNISSNNQVKVKLNNQPVGFVYNVTTHSFSSTVYPEEGQNTLQIIASGVCGITEKSFVFTYQPPVLEGPPAVVLTNPATPNFTSNVGAMQIKAVLLNITSANQINVKVNGVNKNFTFNGSTNQVVFNQSLVEGVNTVIITAVNSAGSATDEATITYEVPTVTPAPKINWVNPKTNPTTVLMTAPSTPFNVIGTVDNINAEDEVQILINNEPYGEFTPTLNEGVYTFNFWIYLTRDHNNFDVKVLANTEGGSDTSSRTIKNKNASRMVIPGGGKITIGKPGIKNNRIRKN